MWALLTIPEETRSDSSTPLQHLQLAVLCCVHLASQGQNSILRWLSQRVPEWIGRMAKALQRPSDDFLELRQQFFSAPASFAWPWVPKVLHSRHLLCQALPGALFSGNSKLCRMSNRCGIAQGLQPASPSAPLQGWVDCHHAAWWRDTPTKSIAAWLLIPTLVPRLRTLIPWSPRVWKCPARTDQVPKSRAGSTSRCLCRGKPRKPASWLRYALRSVVSDSLHPHDLEPSRLLCPWDSPGRHTGAGCHFLLQGIFLTQESNPRLLCLLHWQADPYHCATWEASWLQSFQFSRSVVSDSLQPHGLQHSRGSCLSPTPGVYSNSSPLSQWCHPTISSSVVPFSPTFNLSQHQGLFQWVSS